MSLSGKITVITPPDKLFNTTPSFLLVKPSLTVKKQFQQLLQEGINDTTVFIFDDGDEDIDWLLSVVMQADNVVVDVDNCDAVTKQFISYMIAFSHVFYITEDDTTPYSLISRNRIKDLTAIIEEYVDDDDDYNEDEDDDDL